MSAIGRRTDASPRLPAANTLVPSALRHGLHRVEVQLWVRSACATKGWARGRFIEFGEAVGSRTLSKKYGIEVSPATIRNVVADLEEGGFLYQPHTSAGPSASASTR